MGSFLSAIMTYMKPQSFIFLGRYGAGKGTQSKLLVETLKKIDPSRGVVYVEPGGELRKFISEDTYTAKLVKASMESGALLPEFMPIHMWARFLAEHYTGSEHAVFDGAARKLLEAQILVSVFPFYKFEKPWVIYLDVHHEESAQRLALRQLSSGRKDDQADAVLHRKQAYEESAIPAIEWYRNNPDVRFLEINGVGPIDAIHADIVKRLGLV